MAASLGDKQLGDKFLKLTGVKKLEAVGELPSQSCTSQTPDIAKKTQVVWSELEKQYQQGLHYNHEKKGLS
jgi:hypothetical protein